MSSFYKFSGLATTILFVDIQTVNASWFVSRGSRTGGSSHASIGDDDESSGDGTFELAETRHGSETISGRRETMRGSGTIHGAETEHSEDRLSTERSEIRLPKRTKFTAEVVPTGIGHQYNELQGNDVFWLKMNTAVRFDTLEQAKKGLILEQKIESGLTQIILKFHLN